MKTAHKLAVCVFGIVCATRGVEAQDLSHYRNFELGSDIDAVATTAHLAPADAKTLHQRPALLQNLEYRPSRWVAGSPAESTDPVEQILFSFYDRQLFRMVVDYAPDRTEGMTRADLVEAIVAVYGPVVAPAPQGRGRAPSRLEGESGSLVARWEDSQHAVRLYQTSSYRAAFRLIVIDVRLEDLARKAEAQALRLDDREAPQREIVRQQKERDDGRTAAAKARAVNKGVFRP